MVLVAFHLKVGLNLMSADTYFAFRRYNPALAAPVTVTSDLYSEHRFRMKSNPGELDREQNFGFVDRRDVVPCAHFY